MAMGVCPHLEWVMLLPRAQAPQELQLGWQTSRLAHYLSPNPTRRRQLALAQLCRSHAASAPPGLALGRQLPRYYEVLTAPISKVSAGSSGAEPPATSLPACEGAAAAPPPQTWHSPFLLGQILDQWFESEPLKATLATDAVIGAMASPHTPGSG